MDKNIFEDKIAEEFKRSIVFCMEKALNDDIPRYLEEFDVDTKNGLPHQVFDLISGNMKKHLIKNEDLSIIKFKRSGWDGRIIIDDNNNIVYTIMRTNRLKSVKKGKRKNPHYAQSIAAVLNQEVQINIRQLGFGDICEENFNYQEYENDFNKIFNGKIKKEDGYRYYAILFEERHKELKDVKICLLDKYLDIADEISLYEYIRPDFDLLLRNETADVSEQTQTETSTKLLDFKPRSLNKIKKKEIRKPKE